MKKVVFSGKSDRDISECRKKAEGTVSFYIHKTNF